MSDDDWLPEIVIGVDFGMTSTGILSLFLHSPMPYLESPIMTLLIYFPHFRGRILHGAGLA